MESEKSYYMIITNEDDYESDLKNEFRFLGFPDRNRISVKNMKIGDRVIVYVSKKSVFMACVEVTGKYFYSESKVWSDSYDLWPHRIYTTPIKAIDNVKKGIYIKEIWENLSFIKNKHKWGSQVQGSFRRLSKEDYNAIFKSIEVRCRWK